MEATLTTSALVRGDLLSANADVIVIPCSSSGEVAPDMQRVLDSFGQPDPPVNTGLGDVTIVHTDTGQKQQRFAFACTSHRGQSTYAAIYRIGKALARIDATSIAAPILGLEDLDPVYSYHILTKSFYEENNNIKLNIYIESTQFLEQIQLTEYPKNALQTAIEASLLKVAISSANTALSGLNTFYFEYAEKKYLEFINYTNSPDFYNELLTGYQESKTGFEEFMLSLSPSSEQYKFIRLIGQLISYIDTHAASKRALNEYSDKRTMAQSNVRQPVWVTSFIQFKLDGNSAEGLPHNVRRALEFLADPEHNLMVLSYNHRVAICEALLGVKYGPDFQRDVFNYFQKLSIRAVLPKNNGVLYTRLLYTPEVQELWLPPVLQKMKVENDTVEQETVQPEASVNFTANTIKATFHSDTSAEIDLFNYEMYASAIVKFLTLNDTHPPLTIGILAPWGKGKTTLMRFIEKKLRSERSPAAANNKPSNEKAIEETVVQASFKMVQHWLNDTIFKYIKDKIFGSPDRSNASVEFEPTLEYPVVWFNAWKFQKTQQIWAAFAYEIIQQLVRQVPDRIQREQFWLKLNLARIDKDAIRDQLYSSALKKIFIVGAMVTAVLLVVLKFVLNLPFGIPVSVVTGLLSFWPTFQLIKKNTPDVDTSKFLVQPNYKTEMGYLYSVEQDLQHVFRLLTTETKPAVIFIDDLDRCSPEVTAELIEAINSFISSDCLKCYFVLGQDAQMVAAALDVKYDKIGEKITDARRQHGSLGWSFMEKFVQLQFNIPVLSASQRELLLKSLFNAEPEKELSDEAVRSNYEELMSMVQTAPDTSMLLSKEVTEKKAVLMSKAPNIAARINEEILSRTAKDFNDTNIEADNIVSCLARHLGDSPRGIKRFVNLYRFYRFIQSSGINDELAQLDYIVLGRWVVLMIRWPQLIRAIQWNSEAHFLDNMSIQEKAKEIHKLFLAAKDLDAWQTEVKDKGWSIPCLNDPELYAFMKTLTGQASLEKAFEYGIW